MAAVDQNLFLELKGRYPELPEHILTSCMSRYGNDREKCMETLAQESPKYLFDETLPNSVVNDNIRGISEMKISEPRPRSDSTGSNRSNASTGSGTASRPPYHASHSLINVPGYRGPISYVADDGPHTAPINSSAINQFIDIYGSEQTPHNIPNINCNNSGQTFEGANYTMNYGRGHSGNSPPNISQHQKPGMRQLEVQHIRTSPDHTESNSFSQPANFSHQIWIDPANRTASPVLQNSQVHHITPNRTGWSRHANVHSGYQNVTFPNSSSAAFSDLRSNLYTPNYPQSYKSPVEEHPSGGHPSYNQYGTHSSQATIYLSTPVTTQNPQYNTPIRANLSPLPEQYGYMPGGDPGLSPNYARISPGFGHLQCGNAQSSPKGLGRPIVVEIKSSNRDNTGVQSHINFLTTFQIPAKVTRVRKQFIKVL